MKEFLEFIELQSQNAVEEYTNYYTKKMREMEV